MGHRAFMPEPPPTLQSMALPPRGTPGTHMGKGTGPLHIHVGKGTGPLHTHVGKGTGPLHISLQSTTGCISGVRVR
jgi:hypothetical protein